MATTVVLGRDTVDAAVPDPVSGVRHPRRKKLDRTVNFPLEWAATEAVPLTRLQAGRDDPAGPRKETTHD
jgi:hypothetical protein